jgi:hypothetical protein
MPLKTKRGAAQGINMGRLPPWTFATPSGWTT